MDRLLILSCSATKHADAGLLPARQRYQGPLWQTLRAVDPDAQLAQCFALSAAFGLVRDDELLPPYDALMTRERAIAMVANPVCQLWRRGELPRQADERGDRWNAAAVMNRTAKPAGGFREVCIVGGHLYLPVAKSIVRDLQILGHVAPDAPVRVVNGEIGNMRASLRAWLNEPLMARRAA